MGKHAPYAPRRHGRPGPWRRRHPSGLRRRLQATFAFVALAAVGLTTFLTLGSLRSALQQFFDAEPGIHAPSPPGAGSLPRAGVDDTAIRGAFRQVTRTAFVAAFLAFVLASMAAALMTRRLTRPLLDLTEGARRLAAGERVVHLPLPAARDELRTLTESFNRLGEGLERQEAWRRAMVADIAHDLRTPLAVLRSEIEAMQDGLRHADEAGLTRLHGEVMMLARLVDDLRSLSVVESGTVSLARSVVDVHDLLARAVDAFTTRAKEAGVVLRLASPNVGLSASVDPDRILQVLGNLIDNALRYGADAASAGTGGEVVVSAAPEGSGIVITVADRGKGLGTNDPERLFERLYRGDAVRGRGPLTGRGASNHGAGGSAGGRAGGRSAASAAERGGRNGEDRSAGTASASHAQAADLGATSGSGLGLAIARALVNAHGGTITAHERDGGGAEFRVWLPANAEAAAPVP